MHTTYHGYVLANTRPSSGMLGVHAVSNVKILTMIYIRMHHIAKCCYNKIPYNHPPSCIYISSIEVFTTEVHINHSTEG